MSSQDSKSRTGASETQNFSSPAGNPNSLGELVAKITAQLSSLVRDELRFAQVQAKSKVTKLGIGGALLAVAGVLAVFMLIYLLHAAAWGFASLVGSTALGYLIVGLILLLIVLIVALLGLRSLKASKKHEVNPKAGLMKDVDAIKKGIKK